MKSGSSSGLGAIAAQMRELRQMVTWVIRSSRRMKPQIIRVALLDLVSLIGWFAALAGFVELLRSLELGTPFRLGPISMTITGVGEVLGVCTLLAVLGGFAALFNYLARRASAAVSGALLIDLRRRLLSAVSESNDARAAQVSGRPRKWLRPLIAKCSAMTALGLWSMLNTLLPAGIAVITATYLVVLDPLLSFMLVPLLVPYLLALARAYGRVASARRSYLEVSPEAVGDIVDALAALAAEDGAHEANFEAATETIDAAEHSESVELFFELRLVTQRVKMINGVFLVVCLAAVLSFYVPLIEDTERTWADPVVYVIGLRLLLLAAQKVSGGLAMVSRRLPEITALSRYLDAPVDGVVTATSSNNLPSLPHASVDLEGDL